MKSTSEKSETDEKTDDGETVKPVGFTVGTSHNVTDDDSEERDREEFDRITKKMFPNGFRDREDEHDATVMRRKIKEKSSLNELDNKGGDKPEKENTSAWSSRFDVVYDGRKVYAAAAAVAAAAAEGLKASSSGED